MEEEMIDLSEPEAIDEDWNSPPDDKLEPQSDVQEEEDAPAQDGRTADGRGTADSGGSDQSFMLKHLSEIRTVGRDEVITLAQKGLDYDRIRGKYDAAAAELGRTNDAYVIMKEMAESQGMTAEALIDATRTQLLVQKHRLAPQDAAGRVRSMRASLDRANGPERETAARRQNEIHEFLGEYGTGIDPKSIPPEVWQSVSKGKTLLAAYQAWELKKLRAESGAARKNTENKERSAGSRFSAAGVKPRDAIADDWYDG
jgi:hypothetical protein